MGKLVPETIRRAYVIGYNSTKFDQDYVISWTVDVGLPPSA